MFARTAFPATVVTLLMMAGCGGGSGQPAASGAKPASSLAGATPASSPSAAKPAGGPADKGAVASPSGLTKIPILFSATSIDTVPYWVALDGSYFQRNGLDVDLRGVAGGAKTIAAVLAGESQVSVQGGNEAMSAVSGGADLVLIGSLMPVYPFKFEAAQGINSLDDVKGKKLGVSTIGGTADVALRTFLRKHGIDPDKDVNIVATGDSSTTSAALRSGAIQASLSVPPNSLLAEAAGTHPIADLAQERLPNAQNSVTVQRAWLNANRPLAQKITDSLVQATARIKQDKAFTQQVITKYLKYDDQKGIDYTYDYFANEVWPDYPHVAPEQLSDGLAELGRKNEKLKNFDPARMIDDSLVQDAEKRAVARGVHGG
jgi:NitT/TauT family transport system substrate-binding protein